MPVKARTVPIRAPGPRTTRRGRPAETSTGVPVLFPGIPRDHRRKPPLAPWAFFVGRYVQPGVSHRVATPTPFGQKRATSCPVPASGPHLLFKGENPHVPDPGHTVNIPARIHVGPLGTALSPGSPCVSRICAI